jgi:L-alanine-DL-glutamate epimerase-like enolase superfamily enzyme
MRIVKVVAHLLHEEVKPYTWQVNRPGSGDGLAIDRAYTSVIRVVTDEGVEGHVVGRRGRVVMDMVERRIGKELLGKDPLNTEFLWERIWDIDRLEEFPLYVLGLADIALWDIKGKVAKLPVCKLIGGYRDSIPAQASTTSYDTEKEYLDVIGAALAEGYTAVKLHLRYRDVKTNAKLCRTVRKFVGDEYDLSLDASALWNYTDSSRCASLTWAATPSSATRWTSPSWPLNAPMALTGTPPSSFAEAPAISCAPRLSTRAATQEA